MSVSAFSYMVVQYIARVISFFFLHGHSDLLEGKIESCSRNEELAKDIGTLSTPQ